MRRRLLHAALRAAAPAATISASIALCDSRHNDAEWYAAQHAHQQLGLSLCEEAALGVWNEVTRRHRLGESVNASAAESATRLNTGAVSPSARSARTTKDFFAAVRRPYVHETRARAHSSVISSPFPLHSPFSPPLVPHTAHPPLPTITIVDNAGAIPRRDSLGAL